MMQSQRKIEAIYELREAAETKARLEMAVERDASPAAREALLDATLEVEARTQDAIEVCHECGHAHPGDRSHAVAANGGGNVIRVDFRTEPDADVQRGSDRDGA
jgi:hypothetical protein